MKLDDLLTEWEKDCKIDKLELDDESLKTVKLHSKYYSYYIKEKFLLLKLQKEYKELHLQKYEFYTQGPTPETKNLGWELPAKGCIIKSEVPIYMDADKHLIEMNLRIYSQKEKVDFLKDCIQFLNNRGYAIKNSIEFIRWSNGG